MRSRKVMIDMEENLLFAMQGCDVRDGNRGRPMNEKQQLRPKS